MLNKKSIARAKRRRCREVKIGKIKIGGDNPIVVQSMSKTFTSDVESTVREIRQLQRMGCQIVRVAVRDDNDAAALKRLRRRVSVSLVADIHFDKNLAIKAIESGVDKIRLNPGNIYKKSEIEEIARVAKQACIPIRVGVNSGSLIHYREKSPARAMIKSALDYINILEKVGFYNIVVSVKSSDIFTTIQANEGIAKLCDYPLHLGVTATGPSSAGIVKSAIVIGRLLSEGIGDTIRISLTDRATEEIKISFRILEALGLIGVRPQIISCPTCGRCEVDLVKIVKELEEKFSSSDLSIKARTVKIAVMGCVVNGPGEARMADLGVAFGKKDGLLFRRGKPSRKISFSRCADVLLRELKKIK